MRLLNNAESSSDQESAPLVVRGARRFRFRGVQSSAVPFWLNRLTLPELARVDRGPDRSAALQQVMQVLGRNWVWRLTRVLWIPAFLGAFLAAFVWFARLGRLHWAQFWLPVIFLTVLLAGEAALYALLIQQARHAVRSFLCGLGLPTCLHCGYDVRGQTEPRCPECGRAFDPGLLHGTPRSGEW